MSALVQSGENGGERGAVQGHLVVPPHQLRQGSLYSTLPDLHATQTSTQACLNKVTPRPLLAARAQNMCHLMGSRGPPDFRSEAAAQGGHLGIRGFPRWRKARESWSAGCSQTQHEPLGTPADWREDPRRSPEGWAVCVLKASADVSLPGPCHLPVTARAPGCPPPPPYWPRPHAPGQAERQTAAPKRPGAGWEGRGQAAGPAAYWPSSVPGAGRPEKAGEWAHAGKGQLATAGQAALGRRRGGWAPRDQPEG